MLAESDNKNTPAAYAEVAQAVRALQAGQMIVLVDDRHRENEGDLILCADHVTPEAINFMVTQGRGLVCLALTAERLERFAVPMMPARHVGPLHTAFSVSVDARTGISTGISAADRARTVQVMMDPEAGVADLVMPGHLFPVRAHPEGLQGRQGHTEGAVALASLAGCQPAAVMCEIMCADGSMARRPDLQVFAQAHQLLMVDIQDLI